jgi:cell wall-associated NlpC family hydrolase
MKEQEQELQSFLQQVEERGRTARRRALLSTLVPIIVGAILLVVIGIKINDATTQLTKLQQEQTTLQQQNTTLQKQNANLQGQLKESLVYAKHIYSTDWINMKLTALSNPSQFKLFETVRQLSQQSVTWNAYGSTPEQGFNSPGFASYVLNEMGISTPHPATSDALRAQFESTSQPQVGDLIFYGGGFVMFYFKANQGHPFCIGMTPVGIVSLEINFGPSLLGYGRVKY